LIGIFIHDLSLHVHCPKDIDQRIVDDR